MLSHAPSFVTMTSLPRSPTRLLAVGFKGNFIIDVPDDDDSIRSNSVRRVTHFHNLSASIRETFVSIDDSGATCPTGIVGIREGSLFEKQNVPSRIGVCVVRWVLLELITASDFVPWYALAPI